MRTLIKICGITQLNDALYAADAGANAIGFVFYPQSPRYITPEKAADIIRQLPPFITTVALFVNASELEIQHTIQQTQIGLLQFHGDEDNTFCKQFSRPFIKAIRVKQDMNVQASCAQYPNARGLLLDAWQADLYGGTGKRFNWSLVPQDYTKPIIVAGGLTPDNVRQAIEATHCYGVDVSGGVEKTKGIKDHEKVLRFCQAAKTAK